MGELAKQLFFCRVCAYQKDVLKIIDEAKKEFPRYIVVNETNFIKTYKWFQKWFGDE